MTRAMVHDVPLFGAIVLCAAGILFAGFAWRIWEDVRAFRRHGALRQARVTRVERLRSRKNRTTYRPIFALIAGPGRSVERPGFLHSAGHDLPVGSTHPVLVLPDRREVLMAECRGGLVLPLLLAALAAGFLVTGLPGLAGQLGAF